MLFRSCCWRNYCNYCSSD